MNKQPANLFITFNVIATAITKYIIRRVGWMPRMQNVETEEGETTTKQQLLNCQDYNNCNNKKSTIKEFKK